MSQGFIFSVDALFAVIIAFAFLIIIFSILTKVSPSFPFNLLRQGMSVVTVLEHLNTFDSPLETFAETSDSVCMRLEVFNGTGSVLVSTFVKAGCPLTNELEYVVWRSSTRNNEFKTLKLSMWLKKSV